MAWPIGPHPLSATDFTDLFTNNRHFFHHYLNHSEQTSDSRPSSFRDELDELTIKIKAGQHLNDLLQSQINMTAG